MNFLSSAKKMKVHKRRFHSGIALEYLYNKVNETIPPKWDWKYKVVFNSVRTLCKKLGGKEGLVKLAIDSYVDSISGNNRFDVKEFKQFILSSGVVENLKERV